MSDSEINNMPVKVTGEERGKTAYRLLARACIALARLRQEREAAAGQPKAPQPSTEQEQHHD